MTWNSSLAPPGMPSDAPLDGNGRHRPWSFVAQYALLPREPAASCPFRLRTSAPPISPPGRHFARPLTIVTRAVVANSAFAVIHRPILPRWKRAFTDQVCRRSFFSLPSSFIRLSLATYEQAAIL